MENNADVAMADSGVLESAELNGHDATINPAVFTLERQTFKAEPLPPSSVVASAEPNEPLIPEKGLDEAMGVVTTETSTSSDYDSTSDDGLEELDFEEIARPSQQVQVIIPPPPSVKALPYASSQSGLIYDWRMREHCEPMLQEEDEVHPEDPRRISEIFEELCNAGLVDDPKVDEALRMHPKKLLWRLGFGPASPADLSLVHSRQHIKWVQSLIHLSDEDLVELAHGFDSVYLHRTTWMCARLAAGGAIEACKAVVQEKVRNSIALIRPPGHHAEQEQPGGFCFFDNVAVAARTCQRDYPESCRKVFILDWDVHHGNGVQQAFYSDPNVLYISLHVYDNGTFYPQGPYGNHLHCGEGAGVGFNVNVPWPKTGMHDGDYMYAFQKVVMPIATEFDPDLVIISAGFDAAEGDMLGGCHVSPPAYAQMTHMLMSLARGKVAVCLEGGYNLRSIARSALAVTKTLMGEPPERLTGPTGPSAAGLYTVDLVMRHQAKYWRSMFPKVPPANLTQGERIHDVVRSWQKQSLFERHHMTPLPIVRERMSSSFENQVLATPNFDSARPLLVIFHDPPELHGIPDPRTNKLELHNAILTDVTNEYVDWAIGNDFAVIDVNIPRHISDPDEEMTGAFVPAEDPDTRAEQTRSLANYLFENYIEINDCTHLFLMGVGGAYTGLVDVLSNNENCSNRTTHVISFVCDNALQAVRRHTDDYFPIWYFTHSSVYISEHHDALDPNRGRKPRKKYGRLVSSPHSDLVSMLVDHKDDVADTLLAATADWREEQKALEQQAQARQQQEKLEQERRSGTTNNSGISTPFGRRSAATSPTGLSPAIRIDESRSPPSSSLKSPTGFGPPLGVFTVGRQGNSNSPKQPTRSRDSRSPSRR